MRHVAKTRHRDRPICKTPGVQNDCAPGGQALNKMFEACWYEDGKTFCRYYESMEKKNSQPGSNQ